MAKVKRKIISYPELRLKYFNETGKQWIDANGNIQEEYVTWLENIAVNSGIHIEYKDYTK